MTSSNGMGCIAFIILMKSCRAMESVDSARCLITIYKTLEGFCTKPTFQNFGIFCIFWETIGIGNEKIISTNAIINRTETIKFVIKYH